MTRITIASAALAAALSFGIAQAQPFQVGQDLKDAGHSTADATKTAAHDTVHGTKVATRKTKHVVKKGYHKTAHGTRKVAHKIEGKPDTPVNNPR